MKTMNHVLAAALLALSALVFAQPAAAQLGANSTQTQIGGMTADHVKFTGGTDSGVAKTGGTIDGTVIGGTTPAAITGTTLTGTPALSGGTMSGTAISGGSITGATITGTISAGTVRNASSVTANATTTYANVGLTQTVVPGTYKFSIFLPSTVASGTGGIKYAFNYTTAVLSGLESTSRGYTASAVAVQHVTSTTTQTDLFTQAAVVIFTEIEGTMVVTTGGTVDVQVAQNTSNASNTIALLGASFQMTRIS